MKRALAYIAFFVVLGLLIAAYSERVVKADEGFTAPPIEGLTRADSSTVSLEGLRGMYVLVNFWNSDNAVSRIAAGEYDRFARSETSKPLCLLSVNTDVNPQLFREIVRRDHLDEATQFHIADAEMRHRLAPYRLDRGYSSYLVDPQGKIVAVNPSVPALKQYLNAR